MARVMMATLAVVAMGCSGLSTATRPQPPVVMTVSRIQSGADPDRLICRSMRATGSHLYRVSCQTQKEIDAEREDTQNRIVLSLYKVGEL